MASRNITFSGENKGTQVVSNYGQIHQTINYGPSEGTPIKPKPCSTVPFRQDPDFVDRRDILAKVEEICSRPASRAALVGLGGVGKSQLAIEYSYRIRNKSSQTGIFWVHASNAARFEEGYRAIADKIELPHRNEPKADILRLVSNWLSDETNGQWIMILDNADDSRVFSSNVDAAPSLSTFLPQTPNGSILVTSRSGDAALRLTGRHQDIITVDPMDEEHALLLFKNKFAGETDRNDTKALLRALDYMPLAISQAAAYISQRTPRTTVAGYLHAFRKSDKSQTNLLNRDTGDLRRDSSASNSIITTWQISFEYLRTNMPSAARLLSLMSFFDRQGIPESLLHCYDDGEDGSDSGFEYNFDYIDSDDHSGITFEDDIFTLTSYSLIKATDEDYQFEMHRLVQLSTRNWLQLNNELEKWKKKYIKIIWNAFPDANYENWTTCRTIFPHAAAVLAYRPTKRTYLVSWSEVLRRAGSFAADQGNYLLAEEMSRQALDGSEITSGKDHPRTLTCVGNLASVLRGQGKYKAAEKMTRQALDGKEKVLGKEHPSTLTSVANLALALWNQGKYEAAEEMSRRALDGSEKTLGKEHPDTLTSVAKLATVLRGQGKFEEAEEMSRRALEGQEKALSKEHPNTLISASILASVLRYQRKYEEAEEMSRRALEGQEKALGKEHPDTLTSVAKIATVLQDQGKYEEAEEMNRRALEGQEKALGKEHPNTLISASILASVLRYQRKYEAAEEMSRRALEGQEKALGKEHPNTLISASTLASVLRDQVRSGREDEPTSARGEGEGTGERHYASMIEEMNEADQESPSRKRRRINPSLESSHIGP